MLRFSLFVFALAGVDAQDYQDQAPRLRQLKPKTHKASKTVRILISSFDTEKYTLVTEHPCF